MAVWI